MGFDTLAARNRDTGRWHTALAVSLSLHVAVVVYAVTASSTRRDEPAAVPVVVTVLPEQATPLPSPVPKKGATTATVATPERPTKRAARQRSDRSAKRLALLPEPLPVADRPLSERAVSAADDASGELIVRGTGEHDGGGAGKTVGVVSAAHGPEVSTPRILPPAEGNGQLAIDPNEVRYQPVIPSPLRRPGARFAPLVKLCVKKDGSVGDVTVMRPSDPAVDPAIVEKIRLFKFKPYLDHGRPIPFCFFREYRLSVEE